MKIPNFKYWLIESQRPLKKLNDLSINRKYKGERYEYELFPRLRRLQARFKNLDRKPNLEEFFNTLQLEDSEFYTLVQTDVLGQPDVRELWRDLTGQRSSRMKRYNLAESASQLATWKSSIDPSWQVIAAWPEDSIYSEISDQFDQFGTAFADLSSQTVYIDGVQIENLNLTQDHLLAIESHEIAHYLLGHRAPASLDYDERQEREADWLGIRLLDAIGEDTSAQLLEERYSNQYGTKSEELEEVDYLLEVLRDYLKNRK